ncbi:signal peptidase II [soil metagenome]
MNRTTPLGRLALILALVVIVLDQITKAWVLGPLALRLGESHPVIPGLFNFTLVHNEGVSFHLLVASTDLARWALVVFSLIVAVGLAVWAQRSQRRLTACALGLVIGGAVGNAVDRARLGHVTDFIDFSGLHFPWVFNVADSAISVGVAILLIESFLTPAAPSSSPDAPKKA